MCKGLKRNDNHEVVEYDSPTCNWGYSGWSAQDPEAGPTMGDCRFGTIAVRQGARVCLLAIKL